MIREWSLQSGTSRKGGIFVGLTSLLIVALGLFLLVGLIQIRFGLGASAQLGNFGGVAGFFYEGFGWIPSFYFSLLLLIWGGLSFVNGELSDPVKRILASVCFMFFFAGLVSSLGGSGGSMGGGASASMAALIGAVPSGFFFSLLTLLGLFLATDWFFYKGFKRFLLPVPLEIPEDIGLVEEEERQLLNSVEDQSQPSSNFNPNPVQSSGSGFKEKLGRGRGRRGTGRLVPDPLSKEPSSSEKSSEKNGLDKVLQQARVDLEDDREEVFVFDQEIEDEVGGERFAKPSPIENLHVQGLSQGKEAAWKAEEVWEGEVHSDPLEDGLESEDLDADLFATLENETLLEAAGKALDKILEEKGPSFHQTTLDDMNEVVLKPQPRVEPPMDEGEALSEGRSESNRGTHKKSAEEPLLEPKIEIFKETSSSRGSGENEPAPSQALLFSEAPPEPGTIHRAAQILLTSRRPLPSLLQRRMGIGLAEAREVFARLRDLGALGEPEGRGPWEPLMTLPEWEDVMRRVFGESHGVE
jgi:hypothetical protein